MNKLPPLEYLPESAQPMHEPRSTETSNPTGKYIAPPDSESKQNENAVDFHTEITRSQDKSEKLKRALKSNPFVPIGCLFTIGVLANGLIAMKKKDAVKSQRMMRYRVAAQGATVLALITGTFITQMIYQHGSDE
jgi:hypothetical protein